MSRRWVNALPRYQELNPLDLYFFAADQAMRRIGLPGTNIHLCLELNGRIDVDGLKRAVQALWRVYPATGSRLERSDVTGRPRWRLDSCPADASCVIRICELTDASEHDIHGRIEALLNEPIDLRGLPPVRFVVLRGLAEGDRLVARWPHALMDGRGGVTLLEELNRLYRESADHRSCASAGDESRRDFADLLREAPLVLKPREVLSSGTSLRPRDWRTVRLSDGIRLDQLGPVRFMLRRLTAEQAREARAISLRVCGFARFGDFVRACAIRALDRVAPKPLPHNAGYCTLNLIDLRKRRQAAPVCRNLTNALPMYVPARIAQDRRAVADLARDQMAEMLQSRTMLLRLATVHRFTLLPTSLLVNVLHQRLIATGLRGMPTGMGNAPSLPLGLIGSFSKGMSTFCGAELTNVYGLRPVPFQTGISVDVNEAQDRLNVAAMYYEPAISTAKMAAFLDDFAASLVSME
ncbi:MAG TPA: condensation domain-containing protein [Phycisphaerae bacterium]|nr:condensation domain-containing protein [Phycisphaerae bacterium]HRR86950.1 condensation domain-containing protein [Phycisphaerae bacterium]